MSRRTSASHPLQIAEVRHKYFPGVVGITFCPGKKQGDARSGSWDRDLTADLDVVRQWGASVVMSLIEDHEMTALHVENLGPQIEARGMKWIHLPIVDVSVPDHRFQSGWLSARSSVLGLLKSGGRVIVHCKGGLGRAGMISARILTELGVPVERAIELVKEARPGAIETPEQEQYVRALADCDRGGHLHQLHHYTRLLEQAETDIGLNAIAKAMVALWASRAGLAEEEVRYFADLEPAQWTLLRRTLTGALEVDGGLIALGDEDLRSAVSVRYLSGGPAEDESMQVSSDLGRNRRAHADLARWFEKHFAHDVEPASSLISPARAAEEIPHQWREAKDWQALRAALLRRDMFEAVCINCGFPELLSYWLDLERETDADLMKDYADAWSSWDLDDSSEATGDIATTLWMFLAEAGRYGEFTDRLARMAVAIESSIYGAESEQVSDRLNDMALLLQARGSHDDAELLIRRALALAEKSLGPDHPDTAIRMGNLGSLLRLKGDFDAAEQSLRRSLTILERKLGAEHPSTGTILDNLAQVLCDMGEYEEAEPLHRRALAIAEKSEGPEHRATSICLNNLAYSLECKGDNDEAAKLYRRALAISEKVDGPMHPETGVRLNNLARILQEKGDYENAEPLFRRALSIAETSEGLEHPSTGVSLNNLGMLLHDRGDLEKAEDLLKRALAIVERAHGPEHSVTASSLNNLATVLQAKQDWGAAEALRRRALSAAESVLGPNHPELRTYLGNLAELLEHEKQYEAAEALYRRALAIAETAFGTQHEDVMTCLAGLGSVLYSMGRQEEGESFLTKAIGIAEELEVGGPFFTMAELRIAQKRYVEAGSLLERCLDIRRRTLPASHTAIADTLSKIAELHGLMRREIE